MKNRLCWVENNLKNYTHNFRGIKKFVGSSVKIMAIVKANAYGHGIEGISQWVQELDADFFGVVCLKEARILREAGINKPILILNYTDPESIPAAVDLDLRLNVMDEHVLKTLNQYAQKKGKRVAIHVKVDTGMHRLGLSPEDALPFIQKIEDYKNSTLEGVFTHFATSDETSLSFVHEQLKVFHTFIEKLAERKIHPSLIHAANSAATLRLPSSHFSMVRPGIILYGCPPSQDFSLPFPVKPVLTLKTIVTQIRRIHKGETVGYGRTYTAKRDTLVGALAIGYADGFRRGPTNWGEVLIRERRAKILGRVSMDQSSIDITDVPHPSVGDEVVLIGKQGREEITAGEIAQKIGTINYEILSSLSQRVDRKFWD